MRDVCQFGFVMDPVHVNLICPRYLANIQKGIVEGLVQAEITNEIRRDPGQDLMLFQVLDLILRVQFSEGFL